MTTLLANARMIDPPTPIPARVVVRMACMDLLARNLRAERGRKAVGVMV